MYLEHFLLQPLLEVYKPQPYPKNEPIFVYFFGVVCSNWIRDLTLWLWILNHIIYIFFFLYMMLELCHNSRHPKRYSTIWR